jgi:hypothetical protein
MKAYLVPTPLFISLDTHPLPAKPPSDSTHLSTPQLSPTFIIFNIFFVLPRTKKSFQLGGSSGTDVRLCTIYKITTPLDNKKKGLSWFYFRKILIKRKFIK